MNAEALRRADLQSEDSPTKCLQTRLRNTEVGNFCPALDCSVLEIGRQI